MTKLSELDTSLRDTRANVTIRDEQLLARVELSTRKYCKPVSETTVIDDYVDNLGVVNKKTVHVGERVTLVKSRLRVLEDELTSLWGQLEDAQQQVDALFAELAKRDEEGVPDERGSTATVRASLLQEVAKFEKELEDILDDTHEEARASEKVSRWSHVLLLLEGGTNSCQRISLGESNPYNTPFCRDICCSTEASSLLFTTLRCFQVSI